VDAENGGLGLVGRRAFARLVDEEWQPLGGPFGVPEDP
jgi:hypothetical protein